MSQNGVAQPGSVTFYYTYNSGNPFATPAPTPAPTPVSAQVEILYKKTDGALLYSETRQLTAGTHMITYDNRFEQYSEMEVLKIVLQRLMSERYLRC